MSLERSDAEKSVVVWRQCVGQKWTNGGPIVAARNHFFISPPCLSNHSLGVSVRLYPRGEKWELSVKCREVWGAHRLSLFQTNRETHHILPMPLLPHCAYSGCGGSYSPGSALIYSSVVYAGPASQTVAQHKQHWLTTWPLLQTTRFITRSGIQA